MLLRLYPEKTRRVPLTRKVQPLTCRAGGSGLVALEMAASAGSTARKCPGPWPLPQSFVRPGFSHCDNLLGGKEWQSVGWVCLQAAREVWRF